MSLAKILVATGCAAVLAGVPSAAFAQHHGGGGGGGGHSRAGGAAPRSAPSAPRSGSGSAATGPRASSSVRDGASARGGAVVGGAVPRYTIVAPVRFYRPYYTFRPRLSIGFGLWAGYPFAYSYAFYDPFYYPYPYGYPYRAVAPYAYPSYGYPAYGYPSYGYPSYGYPAPSYPAYPPDGQGPQGSIGVQPGQSNTGGLSFEITPSTAQLFVDGTLLGTVGQFTPTTQPLGLVAGRHQIEVRAPGYQTMSFEVDIIAGQVIPYQGALER